MGRPVKEVKMDSKAARVKLKRRDAPYWRDIGDDIHLGYRRHVNGGAWVVRLYVGGERPYVTERLAAADDGDALSDKENVLSYDEALVRARERARRMGSAQSPAERAMVTVADAIAVYVEAKAVQEDERAGAAGAKRRDARSRLGKHVIEAHPALAAKKLAELAAQDLSDWRLEREKTTGDASARRVLNYFRAALNTVAKMHRKRFPGLADEVRAGFQSTRAVAPVAREHQILAPADTRRLVAEAAEVDQADGWGGDLLAIVAFLAATGARFSQIVRMRVADVQKARAMIPLSAKGRGQKKRRHVAVPVGADVLDLLCRQAAGRLGTDPLFLRPRWRQERVGVWTQYERAPWRSSSELSRPWQRIVSAAGLPAGTVAYAFRHSSIVRQLEAGLPVRLVAELHDTSSAMIESHYAASIADAMSELAARAVVSLLPEAPKKLGPVG